MARGEKLGRVSGALRLTGRRQRVHPLAALKVHLIGIGGTGMGALAGLLKQAGHEVRGSDGPLYPPMSTQLEQAGVEVMTGFRAENLDWGPDCVVVGNVCSRDHVEVVAAGARGLPLESFPSLLAKLLLPGRRSLVVAGTHGKTTTSALLTWLLVAAGQRPSALIGGVPQNLGRGALFGAGEAIVLEGDEYDTAFFDKGSKFFHYRRSAGDRHERRVRPRGHLRGPRGGQGGVRALRRIDPGGRRPGGLRRRCRGDGGGEGGALSGDDVPRARRGRRPGRARTTRRGRRSSAAAGRPCSSCSSAGRARASGRPRWSAAYNLGNILAAVALARKEGVEVEALRDGVRRFRGVQAAAGAAGDRGGDPRGHGLRAPPDGGEGDGDGGAAALPEQQAVRVLRAAQRVVAAGGVLQDGYAEAFAAASRVYVAPLFKPEKIPEDLRLDVPALARAISAHGVEATAYANVDDLGAAVLSQVAPGDTVLLLTSGSFGDLGTSC
jgi:UDP-N-acetylmuramate: L-alanyl-gamma-D-glutamyl-meso-diaminopimelate ligase